MYKLSRLNQKETQETYHSCETWRNTTRQTSLSVDVFNYHSHTSLQVRNLHTTRCVQAIVNIYKV
jgi:hypothetical protein